MFIVFLIRNYRAKIKKCDLIGFKYDQDAVLWHGNECNIAFRDITFLKLLRDITADFDEKYRNKLFLEAGRDMGKGFGKHFKSQIYPKELKKMTYLLINCLKRNGYVYGVNMILQVVGDCFQ